MSQILLIDDELLVIEAIKMNIDWDACGITNVFLCDNGFQAKQIITENKIDIVISDIQMPGMDGLDFCKWLRDYNPNCVAVLLSGYSEFEYAKQALKLGVEDYILKPVDYADLQEKIMGFVKKAEDRQQDTRIKQYFENHKEELFREWVQYILNVDTEFDKSGLKQLLKEFKIDFSEEEQFLLFWMKSSSELRREQSDWFREQMKSCEEQEKRECVIVNLATNRILTVIRIKDAMILDGMDAVREVLAGVIADAAFSCCGYLSEMLSLDQLVPVLRKISEREQQNVIYQNRLLLVGNRNIPVKDTKVEIDYKKWLMLLETNDMEQLKAQIEVTIHSIVIDGHMDTEMLQKLYNYFNQMVYFYIGEAYDDRIVITQDSELSHLQAKALNSVDDFRKFYRYFLDKIMEFHRTEVSSDVLRDVKKYIDEHIGEKISRSQLAEQVYLNENYLSRLFHKKEGCSISNYILQKRMEIAKKLLIQTKLSVSQIGEKIGYDTTTYFIRTFKQETGKTPNDYRKDMRI